MDALPKCRDREHDDLRTCDRLHRPNQEWPLIKRLQATEGDAVMAYEALETLAEGAVVRSTLRDRALLAGYFLAMTVAMSGWLWFLGSLSWRLIGWALR
jgi:hypothetical protein